LIVSFPVPFCTRTRASRFALKACAWPAGAVLMASAVWAQTAAAQGSAATIDAVRNVVSLTASASVEVQKDWLTVVFSTTREGADANAVQAQLRQALDTALNEARKVAKPGQVEVQTGSFSLHPRYANKPNAAPAVVGWQGNAELVVEGRDVATLSQLTGRINTLSIGRVAFSLSREAREKVEGEVTAQAIARFRARAEAVSRQFGFTGYVVREVVVGADTPVSMAMVRAQGLRASAEESLPVEAGKATVTSQVSGSVQMR
jgi:predicted secreted protein